MSNNGWPYAGYGAGAKIVAGENVAGLDVAVTNMLPIIINEIWSDPVHRGAMTNPKYQDVGAGIATDGNVVFITLNLAGIVPGSTDPITTPASNLTASPLQTTPVPDNPAILPLYTSTAQADGAIYHVVGYGQTLSTIARIYQVDINELVRLNQIEPDRIYAGQKIIIKPAGMVVPEKTPVATDPPGITFTPKPTSTSTYIPILETTSTGTPTALPVQRGRKEASILMIYILLGIISVLSLVYFQNNHTQKT